MKKSALQGSRHVGPPATKTRAICFVSTAADDLSLPASTKGEKLIRRAFEHQIGVFVEGSCNLFASSSESFRLHDSLERILAAWSASPLTGWLCGVPKKDVGRIVSIAAQGRSIKAGRCR
ncbi:hypothetical protein AC579_8591 [Pseudocercospora musae]|uniref:Uncharacterized protein n=1 Tax=Pseudocercospora musae TaxID=113226 RepID=A0A139IB07_9PEZI|nr:hypothetical protein AC579_8591 [Pseudocercospora musae]